MTAHERANCTRKLDMKMRNRKESTITNTEKTKLLHYKREINQHGICKATQRKRTQKQ